MRRISRRSFLAGGAVAVGGWALLPGNADAKEEAAANRFVLMADIHVCADRTKVERGCNPDETFQQAVKDILELTPRPAGLIVAGDCAYIHGRPVDYNTLKGFLNPLRDAGIAILLAMGNHDNRNAFQKAFPEAAILSGPPLEDRKAGVVETEHADWFLLDSLEKTDYTPGLFGEEQLKWLAARLDKNPSKPALLVAHHGLKLLPEDHLLTDTEAFLDVISPRKQVKCFFYGHTHIWLLGQRADGIHLVNLPANAWLFNDRQPRGFVDAWLAAKKIDITLHCLDRSDPRHGEKHTLEWRS